MSLSGTRLTLGQNHLALPDRAAQGVIGMTLALAIAGSWIAIHI